MIGKATHASLFVAGVLLAAEALAVASSCQSAPVTFTNSLIAITLNTNGTVSSLLRLDNGQQKNNSSPGWSIYHASDGINIPLNHMSVAGTNQLLFWSNDGQYTATFEVTSNNRYFKFELVHVSNNPQTGNLDGNWPGYAVKMNVSVSGASDGWMLNAVPLDYMVDLSAISQVRPSYSGYNPVAYWPYAQYGQKDAFVYPDSQTTTNIQPMGAIAIFSSTNSAQHDDILLDIWGGEPSLPRPNRANLKSWTRTDAAAWLDRWERELPAVRMLMFCPRDLNDLYQVAGLMSSDGLNSLYLFFQYWEGNAMADVNTNLFPKGVPDLVAFKDYCAQRGITLQFHANSCFVKLNDVTYGALSPSGFSPSLARYASGRLLTPANLSATSFEVQVGPGCQPLSAPPPWGDYSIYYPPYYPSWISSCISISNDLFTSYTVQVTSPTTWAVSGLVRNSPNPAWVNDHAVGSQVDFLLSPLVPDSRTPLMATLAKGYGILMNQAEVVLADYDCQEFNQDLGWWGPRRYSQCLYESLAHPVHANASTGFAPFGHFEYQFKRVQQLDGGGGYALEISQVCPMAELRLSDPSLLATHLDEDHFSLGVQAVSSPNLGIGGYHLGTDWKTMSNHGQWKQVVSALQAWQAVQPYLTPAQKAALNSLGPDFYVPVQTTNQWRITPTRAMLREGLDGPWQLMTEAGPLSPRQFNKVGEVLASLSNPYPAQTPQIELFVLPGLSATNTVNVSLMPVSSDGITHPSGEQQQLLFSAGSLSLSATNSSSVSARYFNATQATASYWNYSTLGQGSTLDMSRSRGIALTVLGDNSGSVLVFSIGTRDYAVTVDFSGPKTVIIPNGEAQLYRARSSFGNTVSGFSGTFDYAHVSSFQLFLGYLPPSVTAHVQVTSIQALTEDRATGLVNPILKLNNNSVSIAGTIPYNNYLVYSGGGSATVYDENWNVKTNLAASGATLTALSGSTNTFSVQSAACSSNSFLSTRVKVSGTPWVIGLQAALHQWRFETNTLDSVGTAHGTAVNAPAYVSGKEGSQALNLNGTSQYVDVSDGADLRFSGVQSFTLSAWVRLNSLPNAWAGIANKGPSDYGLWLTPGNQWAFGGATNIVSPVTASVGEWHLLTAVQDGTNGTRKLYVDGVFSCSGPAQNACGANDLRIGASSGGTPGAFLNGAVDDVRLYNAAWSAGEIRKYFEGTHQATELNNRPATGITPDSAVLAASLNGSNTVYKVYACWNTVNAGTNAALWIHSAYVGTWTNAVWTSVINCSATGLLANTQYYCTFYASPAAGTQTIWAPSVQNFKTLNLAPVAEAQTVTLAEDTVTSINLTGSAASGGSLFYSILTYPSKGTLDSLAPNLLYRPAANYTGSDNFTFKVNDGSQDSGVATVSISVTPVNDAPVANAQSVVARANTAKTLMLTGSDIEGAPLTYALVTQPAHGALTGTPPNVTYTPTNDYTGPDSFMFMVNDGSLDSAVATVSISVNIPQTRFWSANATSASWALGGNWAGGAAPAAGDDVVLFGRTANGAFAPTDNSAYTDIPINSLTLQAGPDGNADLSLGSGLMVDAGGISNNLTSSSLALPSVTLNADPTWGGSGQIRCDSINGNSALVVNGAGLRIDSASSYSGGTLVRKGNLAVGDTNALGTGALTWAAPTGAVLSNTVALSASPGIPNALSLVSNMTVSTAGGSLALSGAITGSGALIKSGSGALTLAASNSFSDGLSFANGLTMAAAGALGRGNVTGTGEATLTFTVATPATVTNRIQLTCGNNDYLVNTGCGRITLSGTLTGGNNAYANFVGTGGDGGFVLSASNNFTRFLIDNTTVWAGQSNALSPAASMAGFGDGGHSGKLYLLNGITLNASLKDSVFGNTKTNLTFTVGTDQTNALVAFARGINLRAANNPPNINTWCLEAAQGATVAFASAISQSSTTNAGGGAVLNPLIKVGAGTVVFAAANTYGGVTTVSNGTLWVNNTSGSGTGTNRVNVAAGATLGGVGMITGAVSLASGGTLSPGTNSVGALTVGSLTLASNATFAVQLGGTAAGSYDQCKVSAGPVTVGGALLSVSLASRYAPKVGDAFTIIQNSAGTAVTGPFANEQTIRAAGLAGRFKVSYTGGSGKDVVLLYVVRRETLILIM